MTVVKLQCYVCGTMLPSEIAFARAVRARRGNSGVREASKECGVSAATLSRIERGGTPEPVVLYKLCRWVGYDANTALREFYGARP